MNDFNTYEFTVYPPDLEIIRGTSKAVQAVLKVPKGTPFPRTYPMSKKLFAGGTFLLLGAAFLAGRMTKK